MACFHNEIAHGSSFVPLPMGLGQFVLKYPSDFVFAHTQKRKPLARRLHHSLRFADQTGAAASSRPFDERSRSFFYGNDLVQKWKNLDCGYLKTFCHFERNDAASAVPSDPTPELLHRLAAVSPQRDEVFNKAFCCLVRYRPLHKACFKSHALGGTTSDNVNYVIKRAGHRVGCRCFVPVGLLV